MGPSPTPPVHPDSTTSRPAAHCAEADFQSLAETLSSLIVLIRGDRIIYVNPAAAALAGRPKEWFLGRNFWEVVHPDDREGAIARGRARAAGIPQQKRLTERLIHASGHTIWMDYSIDLVMFEGQPTTLCTGHDVSDLQRAEAALSESAERYRALVEHAPEAIMVLDVEQDRFVDANAHAEQLFGYTRERLLTMGPLDFCPEHQADRRTSCEVVADEHKKVLAGGTAMFEFTHVDAAGREIICQTRLSRLPAAGRQLIRATITDVSELKQLQEKVRHAEKLAAVGVLAAGVAHEIGNPLTALSMAAQSLERRTNDGYVQNKLALIREHIDRIARIVRQMSDLARPPSGKRSRHDLNQIVRRAVDMVRYDERARNAAVDYHLAEGLPAVAVVEDELTQVCINLALNAFDAMAGNPPERPRRLRIRTAVQGAMVRVTFADSGPGVPHEVRAKVFQPFFTTKEVGLGSGLGLSVSYRILQEHGGALLLDEVGEGAAFAFELPVGAR